MNTWYPDGYVPGAAQDVDNTNEITGGGRDYNTIMRDGYVGRVTPTGTAIESYFAESEDE